MLERAYDPETGIIAVLATGILSVAEIDDNCTAVRQMIADLRERERPVRVLYDLTGLPPQAAELESYMAGKIMTTFRDDDRCVILTGDLAAKRHLRTVIRTKQIAVSASRLPAEMWLLYDSPRPR